VEDLVTAGARWVIEAEAPARAMVGGRSMQVTVPADERTDAPEVNSLVEVRGHRWVVSDVDPGPGRSSTVVSLQSVEDGRYVETLDVIWEVEPGRRVLPTGSLPELERGHFDPPQRLAAFLDAVRWSAVTSADTTMLQATVPLRRADRELPARTRGPGRSPHRRSTCCSPTTSVSARPSRPAWSPRSCCCATAPVPSWSSARLG
jgi:hypothetical protein